MQKIIQTLADALRRAHISSVTYDEVVAVLKPAIDAEERLESTAQAALAFITQLRESREDEIIDLLTNNPGENVEAGLAEALGVRIPETDEAVQLRRGAKFKTTGACGDIEYYFNDQIHEIGFIVFPGTEHERVVLHDPARLWSHEWLNAHNIVSVPPVRPQTSVRVHCLEYQEAMDFLIRLTCCAELSQDSLEETTKELLAELDTWMAVPEGPDALQAAARNTKEALGKLISAYDSHGTSSKPKPLCRLEEVMATGEPQACWEALRRAL